MNNFMTDPNLIKDITFLADSTEALLQLIADLVGIHRDGGTEIALPQNGPIQVLVANAAVINIRNRINSIEQDRGSA